MEGSMLDNKAYLSVTQDFFGAPFAQQSMKQIVMVVTFKERHGSWQCLGEAAGIFETFGPM